MLKTLRNAWKVKEIRQKLIFTFMMLVVIRFGSELPIPGVKTDFFADFFASQSNDAFGFFNAMTGGSFTSFVGICIEYYPIYYIFHYHAAADYRDSEAGRDAA